VMHSVRCMAGRDVVWVGNSAEVRDVNGQVLHAGSKRECLEWLAARGDSRAQLELKGGA
jgi:hypothetical protein